MKSDGKRRKIVILGHTGFLGSCLYENFSKETEYEVYGFSSAQIDLLSPVRCRLLADIFDSQTTVIMAAAIIRHKGDSLEFLKRNLEMAINVANVISSTKINHLIFLSSIAVYGNDTAGLICEESSFAPDNFYAVSKACSEMILRKSCAKERIKFTILRPGRIYGGGDTTSPIFKFIDHVVNGRIIDINGDGSHKLYPIHKSDMFQIVRLAILGSITGDYNIVHHELSLSELAEMVFRVCGKRTRIRFAVSLELPVKLRFNIAKFRNNFATVRFLSLEDGLKEYLNQTDKKEE